MVLSVILVTSAKVKEKTCREELPAVETAGRLAGSSVLTYFTLPLPHR